MSDVGYGMAVIMWEARLRVADRIVLNGLIVRCNVGARRNTPMSGVNDLRTRHTCSMMSRLLQSAASKNFDSKDLVLKF